MCGNCEGRFDFSVFEISLAADQALLTIGRDVIELRAFAEVKVVTVRADLESTLGV